MAAQLDEQRRIADDVSKATQTKLNFSAGKKVMLLMGQCQSFCNFGSVSCKFLLIANVTPLTCPSIFAHSALHTFDVEILFLMQIKNYLDKHYLTNLGGYQERLSLLAKHRNTEHEVLQYITVHIYKKIQQFSHSSTKWRTPGQEIVGTRKREIRGVGKGPYVR